MRPQDADIQPEMIEIYDRKWEKEVAEMAFLHKVDEGYVAVLSNDFTVCWIHQ